MLLLLWPTLVYPLLSVCPFVDLPAVIQYTYIEFINILQCLIFIFRLVVRTGSGRGSCVSSDGRSVPHRIEHTSQEAKTPEGVSSEIRVGRGI